MGEPWRLPHSPRGHSWHKDSISAWKAVTASGLVGTLLPMDEPALLRWFRMVDRLNFALDDPASTPGQLKSLSAEIRLRGFVRQELPLPSNPMASDSLNIHIDEHSSVEPRTQFLVRVEFLIDLSCSLQR